MADKQSKDHSKINNIYLPGNTYDFIENQQNLTKPQLLRAQTTLSVNKDKNYLNNTLIADFNPAQLKNTMNANGVILNQEMLNKGFDVSNELNLLSTLKSGKIINFYSHINKVNQSEKLYIEPGILASQLNDNVPYPNLIQHVSLPTLFTNNYASMRFQSGKISHTLKAGFMLTNQHMQTRLLLTQMNEIPTAPQINAVNDLNWSKFTVFTEGILEYQDHKLNATLWLPLNHQTFYYNDNQQHYTGKLNRNFLNPKIMLKYQMGVEHFINFSYGLQNNIGNINDIYRGIILTSYRSLFSNNADLPEQQTSFAILNFNYKKAITLFFFNVQASFSNTSSNTIAASTISNNLQKRVLLPYDNKSLNYSIGINTSKYWFPLRTILNGGISIAKSNFTQLQNNLLFPVQSETINYKGGLTTKISPRININYNSAYIESKSSATNNITTPKFGQLKQEFSATAVFLKNVFLTFSASHVNTRQPNQVNLNYFFADANARIKINRLKTDFELSVTNIANVKKYEAVYVSANSYTVAAYAIPGRIALFKVTFSY